jgi:hypothetical protein
MDWTQRLPDDFSNVEATAQGFTANLAMPDAEDGHLGHQCPGCDRFFKVVISEYEVLPDDLVMKCPYCGHGADTDAFMTPQQRERVDAGADAAAEQYIHSVVEDTFGRSVHNSPRLQPGESGVEVRYTPGTPPPKRTLPTYVEEGVRRTIKCDACGNHQAVYGASAFCYVCGPRDAAATVIEELAAQRQALALEDHLGQEQREEARGLGVFDGLAADAVKSAVTEFEVYAREEFSQRVPNAEAAAKAAGGNVFQRLQDTSDLFAQHAGFALSSLVAADVWSRLLRTFEQRHVLTHNGGRVDQRFLDRVPGTGVAVGQRLIVSRSDAEKALNDLELLITTIEAK